VSLVLLGVNERSVLKAFCRGHAVGGGCDGGGYKVIEDGAEGKCERGRITRK